MVSAPYVSALMESILPLVIVRAMSGILMLIAVTFAPFTHKKNLFHNIFNFAFKRL